MIKGYYLLYSPQASPADRLFGYGLFIFQLTKSGRFRILDYYYQINE